MRFSILSGNIGGDPEIIRAGEWSCFKFSIANNDETKKNDQGGYDKVTSWFDLEYWTKKEHYWGDKLVKGAAIAAECEPKQNTWENADGQKRSKIIFKVLKFPLELKGGEKKTIPPASTPPDDDDVPF